MFSLGLPVLASDKIETSEVCGIKVSNDLPEDIKTNIYAAISFLKNIQGSRRKSSKLHRKIFKGNVSGETYCLFLKKRIKEINYDELRKKSVRNWGGYVAIGEVTKSMHYSKLATILLHEASHSQLKEDTHFSDYGHEYCPNNFKIERIAGRPACDRKAISGYGLQYTFSENLKKTCRNCSQAEIDEVDIMGKQGLLRITRRRARTKLYIDVNH
jgi:hypothetical protein